MKRPRFKRLFRISLRTVFVLATVLCVWLGLKVREAKQQKEAVAWVEENGGGFRVNGLQGEYIESLAKGTKLEGLVAWKAKFSDEEVARL